jgi:hypothetical protein
VRGPILPTDCLDGRVRDWPRSLLRWRRSVDGSLVRNGEPSSSEPSARGHLPESELIGWRCRRHLADLARSRFPPE